MSENKTVIPEKDLPDLAELSGDLRLLAEAIGVPLAFTVGQIFKDTPLRLTGVKKFERRHRDKCIVRDYDRGKTVAQITREYGLSDRHVWRILGQPVETGKTA